MLLEHIASELHDWHPATGRDMYGTNDLDVALRNPIRPDHPSRVVHMVTCHGFLIKEAAYSVTTPQSDDYTGRGAHFEKLIYRSTDVLHESSQCNRFPRMCLVSSWYLTLPTPISGPLRGGRGAWMRILQLVHDRCVNLR